MIENELAINHYLARMVFVTGATGMLGAQLVRYLLARNEKVCALRRTTSNLALLHGCEQHIHWVEGDVLDIRSLEEGISRARVVYHTAAMIAFSRRERRYMYKVNVEGTANVVNCCLEARIEKLVHVSSVGALGFSSRQALIDENTPWKPGDIQPTYAESKFLGELEVWRGIAEGLQAVIINPSVIVGPGWWQGRGPTAIFTKIDEGMPFYPLGSNGYVDVRDVAEVMIRLMHSTVANQRFVVSAENLTYQEYFHLIADALQVKRPWIPLPASMAVLAVVFDALRSFLLRKQRLISSEMVRLANISLHYDNSKLSQTLNYRFRPIRQSVMDTAAKYFESKKNNRNFAWFDE